MPWISTCFCSICENVRKKILEIFPPARRHVLLKLRILEQKRPDIIIIIIFICQLIVKANKIRPSPGEFCCSYYDCKIGKRFLVGDQPAYVFWSYGDLVDLFNPLSPMFKEKTLLWCHFFVITSGKFFQPILQLVVFWDNVIVINGFSDFPSLGPIFLCLHHYFASMKEFYAIPS